ncbi:23S rRNA (uracil(1939)-C(5))-methyltransferase RlmD [Ferrimonas gelatinilytica]|uniref:23S rRNA (uracil(1939)-C(5))-methyltransferase RlmD n=1 Tax=Ferrimonas gelatinilytica TaxID=1255257 RepID=A0ABP9SAH5_9GAMM
MAQFYSPKSKKTKTLPQIIEVEASALDHQGNAVASHEGKVIFVPGLLPGESARVQLEKSKHRFAEGKVVKRLRDHPQRVKPHCSHFDRCGGCQLQYATAQAQREWKQAALLTLLSHRGGQSESEMTKGLAEPLSGPQWHYRRRARIGARVVRGQLLLGFRQRGSNRLLDIDQCPVLAEPLNALLPKLRQQLGTMALAGDIGHVDLVLAHEGPVVVLRVLAPVSKTQRRVLKEWAEKAGCQLLLHTDEGLETLTGAVPSALHYEIGQTASGEPRPMPAFLPGDFVQINDSVNRQMIDQAIEWLQPQPEETGLDLFCGGGNFSFALASLSKHLVGVEGVASMVERASARATELALTNCTFYCADLNGDLPDEAWAQRVDWLLLDPARAGAFGVLPWIPKLAPKRILYISCDPMSLAKDARVLTEQGYEMIRLGLVDMFPHTHHLESMALFVPRSRGKRRA